MDFPYDKDGYGAIGNMVVTPPPEERERRLREGEAPFTCRRICVCEPSAYLTEAECVAYAKRIAEALNTLAALRAEEPNRRNDGA